MSDPRETRRVVLGISALATALAACESIPAQPEIGENQEFVRFRSKHFPYETMYHRSWVPSTGKIGDNQSTSDNFLVIVNDKIQTLAAVLIEPRVYPSLEAYKAAKVDSYTMLGENAPSPSLTRVGGVDAFVITSIVTEPSRLPLDVGERYYESVHFIRRRQSWLIAFYTDLSLESVERPRFQHMVASFRFTS